MLFTELPFLDRFKAAADTGFTGVEYLFPYEHRPEALAEQLNQNGLTQVLFNMPPGDWDKGERGLACLPDRCDEFRAGVEAALRYARALSCKHVHCMAGIAPGGVEPQRLYDTYIGNLRFAAEACSGDGVELLIEPINTQDMPGYYLNRTQQALDVISAVGLANIRLQYDCYHMHIMEGDLAATLERHLGSIAHVQIADAPGRNEPGMGVIPYAALFKHLDAIGYDGWIGCEYRPKAGTLQGLQWMRAL